MTQTLKARPPTDKNPKPSFHAHQNTKLINRSSSHDEREARYPAPVIREVLVPLNGSASAEHALPWAIRIAESAGAQVRLVYVHERMDRGFHGRRARVYRDFDRLLREPGEGYLADVMDRLRRAGARCVAPMFVEGRDVADALAGLSATADLTVIATRRRSWLTRLLLGSVSWSLLRSATKPLFVVRGYDCPADFTARPLLNHALAPLDGSPDSESVLPLLAAIGPATGGAQTLLRVIREDRPFSLRRNAPQAIFELKEVVNRWKAVLPKLKTSLVWSDTRVKQEVLKQAAEQKVDFIGVATREWSPSRIFRPGLAEYLFRHTVIPLLVVKRRSASR